MSSWRELLRDGAESWIRRHYYPKREHVIVSSGTAHKYLPVILGSDGYLDASLINDVMAFTTVTLETIKAVDTDGVTVQDKDGNTIAVFTDANNLETAGDIAVKSGSTEVIRLNNTNNLGTEPDIQFGGAAAIGAEGDLYLFIDSNNDTTDARFIVSKDANNTLSDTELFTVAEDGTVTSNGDVRVLNGVTEVIRLNNTNNLGTEADIQLEGAAMIAATQSLYLAIDSNNNGTTERLVITKDANNTASDTELFSVHEDGRVVVNQVIRAASASGIALQNDAGTTIIEVTDGGPILLCNFTQGTADERASINLFGDGTNAQSGAFYSKLNIFGGNAQTRRLALWQEDSGDAYARSTFSALHLSGGSSAGNVILEHNSTEIARTHANGLSINNTGTTGALRVEGDTYVMGTEAADGVLYLYADQGDDNNDQWRWRAATTGNLYLERTVTTSFDTEVLRVEPGGVFKAPFVYNSTTANAANVYVASGGTLQRSTSSRKYKTDIVDLPDKWGWPFVKRLRPVAFHSASPTDDPTLWHVGLVAEELAEISGGEKSPYVTYGPDDYPEAVQYDRLVAPLILTVQQMAGQIQDLKQRVAALEAKVG